MLSVVIPTLNAAATLPAVLAALMPEKAAPAPKARAARRFDLEVIVSDGGSRDQTQNLAKAAGVRLLAGRPGRGTQLAEGAAEARGDWLLFLHADSVPQDGWCIGVSAFMGESGMDEPGNRERAGFFIFALDDECAAARRLERLVAWRSRWLGLPWGDQGLLISRDFYRALGGYRDWPLMEDVDLVRRIGPRRLVPLPCRAITSARRWRESGYGARSLRNFFCLTLYFLKVPPHRIARLYRLSSRKTGHAGSSR